MACLFGMFPFLFYGREFTPINALFESISGFTTTGASILNDIEALPRGLQFWRIATAWVGGVGIVTLFSMITAGADKSTLSGAEISTVAREPFAGDRSTSFANRMFLTYIALTLVTFFSLKLTGMGWFDAATNAMSACSTCGFCTRNTSIAFYANPAAEVVLTFAMLAAGVHFGILFLAILKGRPKYIWKSETIKVFLSLVVLAIVVVTADLMVNGHYPSFGEALRDASFQVASISTTTGFATEDTTLWPPLSMSILIICSLICGCSGSTSGGIKIDRAILAAKGIYRKVGLTVSPHRVQAVRVDGRMRSDELVNDAYGYIFCYLLIVVVFAAVNLSFGLDFTTGVTASVACIGNVGPGFGEVGSMSNFAAFPTVLKATSMTEMLIGRLEIFPVLYLFRSMRMK
jgi:trk system potassium uptake protein TrkH